MNIGSLEHVNVRTAQLPQTIAWYENVLGMRNGWRPNFPIETVLGRRELKLVARRAVKSFDLFIMLTFERV
jgi:catechol 2,3-dioxygenase-like lactoylglutathione lyase family enzyme